MLLLQFIIKDTNEQPDEEGHRARSGRMLSTGASVPVELGCATLLAHGCVHQLGRSQDSLILGSFEGPITQA